MVGLTIAPIPAKLANERVILDAIFKQQEAEAKVQRDTLQQTVATWTGAKPTFANVSSITNEAAVISTVPTGNQKGVNKWIWLDKGTRENYPIVARRAPRLAYYKVGFKAKTSIKNFKSGAGARANRDFRRPYRVTHPGIKAREWSSELARIRTPQFVRRVNTRIRQASKQLF